MSGFAKILIRKLSRLLAVRKLGFGWLIKRVCRNIYSKNTIWLLENTIDPTDDVKYKPDFNTTLRTITLGDVDDILGIWPEEFANLKQNLKSLRNLLLTWIESDVPGFVACDENGHIIGAMWCTPWTRNHVLPEQLRGRPAYEITRLFTISRARGKGVAVKLLLFAMQYMATKGRTVAYSRILPHREASIIVHQRVGFQKLGILTSGIFIGCRYERLKPFYHQAIT